MALPLVRLRCLHIFQEEEEEVRASWAVPLLVVGPRHLHMPPCSATSALTLVLLPGLRDIVGLLRNLVGHGQITLLRRVVPTWKPPWIRYHLVRQRLLV